MKQRTRIINNEIDQPYAPYDTFASVCVMVDYDGFDH